MSNRKAATEREKRDLGAKVAEIQVFQGHACLLIVPLLWDSWQGRVPAVEHLCSEALHMSEWLQSLG